MALFNHQTHPEFVNDNVHALAEDPRDGTLWIGTDGGVVRWKAHRMSGWHSEAGSTDHRRVNALAVSRDGGVWVGRGGLSRLREGRLTEYPFPFPATARETSCSPMEALGTC